jgi:hypothetical protein
MPTKKTIRITLDEDDVWELLYVMDIWGQMNCNIEQGYEEGCEEEEAKSLIRRLEFQKSFEKRLKKFRKKFK